MSQDLGKEVEVPIENNTVLVQSDPEKQDQDNEKTSPSTQHSSRDQSPQPEAAKAPYNPWADPASFPDGGLQAWLVVAGAAACFFVSWG